MKIFVTAIHTDSGKSLVSALLTEALAADYWKPIQAGLPRDTDYVSNLVSNTTSQFHPEGYLLSHPMSPDAAAELDNVKIKLDHLQLPPTQNSLVIEGAGGILVPLNEENVVVDIASKFQLPIVLVSNLYLGSINHTLLTINELKRRNLPILGIIFNGKHNPYSEKSILQHSGCKHLLSIPELPKVDKESISPYVQQLQKTFKEITHI